MRVVFFGNHTVGVRVLETLRQTAEVVGVVCHPPDPEDGVNYLSVHDAAVGLGLPAVRLAGRDGLLPAFVQERRPDLLWVTDYRYLLPETVLGIAPLGAVNLHPGMLPRYRGRASINWAILRGETEIGLTAHFIGAGMDDGEIILQESISLRQDQDVSDALDLLYPVYSGLTRRVLALFAQGRVPRRPQDEACATAFPRRRPQDGRVDWTQPMTSVWNFIRALAAPYPGAFTFYRGRRVNLWKATASGLGRNPADPVGRIVALDADGCHVSCLDGVLLVRRYDVEGGMALKPGDSLGDSNVLAQ